MAPCQKGPKQPTTTPPAPICDIPPLRRCEQPPAPQAGPMRQRKGEHGHIVAPCPHALAPSLPGPHTPHSRSKGPAHPLTHPHPPAHPTAPPRLPPYIPPMALPAHYPGPLCLTPGHRPLPAPPLAPKPLPAPLPTPRPLLVPGCPQTHRCPPGPGAAPTCLARKPPRLHARASPAVATPPPPPHWLRGRGDLHAEGRCPQPQRG